MARKLLTEKQKAVNFAKAQKRYQAKQKKTRVLIPQFHISLAENESYAKKAFAKFSTKKETMVLGLKLVAKLSLKEIQKLLAK